MLRSLAISDIFRTFVPVNEKVTDILKNMLVKVNHHYLAALFLCCLETCRHAFFSHYALKVTKLSVDGVLRILVTKRHRVGIDDDANFVKGMK